MRAAPQIGAETFVSRRQHRRFEVEEQATFEIKGRLYHCTLVDISAGGAGLTISPMVRMPERQGVLTSPRFGSFVCNIRYQFQDRFGVEFIHDTPAQEVLDAQLGEILGEAAIKAD